MSRYQVLIDVFNLNRKAVVYSLPGMPLRSNSQYYPKQSITLDAQSKNKAGIPYVSVLGTPVFSNLIILPKDESKELRIDACLITLDQTKNIVKQKLLESLAQLKNLLQPMIGIFKYRECSLIQIQMKARILLYLKN